MATRLTLKDATELCQLLNELTDRMWPLDSLADNVSLHCHAEGRWHVLVGPPPEDGDWRTSVPSYPTLLDALRTAVDEYRSWSARTTSLRAGQPRIKPDGPALRAPEV
jgi:hypothetical protein